MDFGALLGGGAVVAVLVASWGYIRAFLVQALTRIIGTIEAKHTLADAVPMYCWNHYRRSPFGVRTYQAWWLQVRVTRRYQVVGMETIGEQGRLYWKGWWPIWVSRGAPKKGNNEPSTGHDKFTRVVFIRGTLNPDQFIIDCVAYYNRQMSLADESNRERRHFVRHIFGTDGKPLLTGERGRASDGAEPRGGSDLRQVAIHRLLQWRLDQLGPVWQQDGQSLDNLALPWAAEDIIQEIRRWQASEAWYRQRGLIWRRSLLTYGPPGTGKTSMIRALAEDLDLPIFVYHLATLYDDELQEDWSRMLGHVPCIALIEDIDAVFEGRENKVGSLTFDSLLNCLDGVERTDGLLTIVTTNRLDKLDAAIGVPDAQGRSTRPGRIDRVLELGPLDTQGRRKLCRRILRDYPELHAELIREGQGETGAQFENRCSMLALQLYWDERHALDQHPAARRADHDGSECLSARALLQRPAGTGASGVPDGDGVAGRPGPGT